MGIQKHDIGGTDDNDNSCRRSGYNIFWQNYLFIQNPYNFGLGVCIIRVPREQKWIYIVKNHVQPPIVKIIFETWILFITYVIHGGGDWKDDIRWQGRGGGLRRPKKGWHKLWTAPYWNMYITDCNQINIYAQNNIIIIIFSLFLDFAFRNCSVAGWLQEDGMVDRGETLNSSRPLGFTHFQPCFDE